MTIRTRRSLALALTSALLLLSAPASAGGWHKHHKHHHKHHHGCGHAGYAPRYVERHYYGYPVYYHDYGYGAPAPEAWFCRPCGHHFDSYDDLHYHVHVSHHIPIWQLPHVIVNATFDW